MLRKKMMQNKSLQKQKILARRRVSPHRESTCSNFHPKWKATLPWVYLYMDGKMFCRTCQESQQSLTNDSSNFVSGCSNFRIESLRSHAKSTGHVQAEKAIRAKERPMEAPLPRVLLTVSEEGRQKMEKLFDVAYMIAKLNYDFRLTPVYAL